jgi:hypothetical protein
VTVPANPPIPKQTQDNAVTLIAALAGLTTPEVRNVWYNGKVVSIDGYKFVDCRFDKCDLHVSSLEFEFERCFISDDTRLIYGSKVARPIALFFSKIELFDKAYPDFAPTRHDDGTISLK